MAETQRKGGYRRAEEAGSSGAKWYKADPSLVGSQKEGEVMPWRRHREGGGSRRAEEAGSRRRAKWYKANPGLFRSISLERAERGKDKGKEV